MACATPLFARSPGSRRHAMARGAPLRRSVSSSARVARPCWLNTARFNQSRTYFFPTPYPHRPCSRPARAPQVRICCLEVMGAAPAQLEHYRQEVRELQSLVADFRREVAELKVLKVASGGSDESLTLDEHTHDEPSGSQQPPDGLSQHLGAPPPLLGLQQSQLQQGGLLTTPSGGCSPEGCGASSALGGGVQPYMPGYPPLQRIYIELEGSPISSWYAARHALATALAQLLPLGLGLGLAPRCRSAALAARARSVPPPPSCAPPPPPPPPPLWQV